MSSATAMKGSLDSDSMSHYDMIQKGRNQLTEILEKDLQHIINALISSSVITREKCEGIEQIEKNPKKKIKLLLIQIQNQGEESCTQFLECLEVLCPGLKQALQCSRNECLLPETESDKPKISVKVKKQDFKECSLLEEKVESQRVSVETNKEVCKGYTAQELEEKPLPGPEQKGHHTKERSDVLQDILSKLKLLNHEHKVLSLQKILEISSGSLKQCTPREMEDLPCHFLRKLLASNVTARDTSLKQGSSVDEIQRGMDKEESIDDSIFFVTEMDMTVSVNPLDVLCAVLLCSDSFLQQEILSKMSLCQFALPLLLPPLETHTCTLMLWAMRDIVKKWRPLSMAESRGFKEESLVLTSMPTLSFVRIGNLTFSKSKLLNLFLSPSQQNHNFFIHQDMECGSIPRKIADGLVEVSCYFPGGEKDSDLFPEPVAVANLRGDAESHQVQFNFLTQVSSAVFIFAEFISEREYAFLSLLKGSSTQYYFILGKQSTKSKETLDLLNKLAPVLELNKSHILVKSDTINNVEFVGKLQPIARRIINSAPKIMSIQKMAAIARKCTIQVDEDSQECQNAFQCAKNITQEVKDVAVYKNNMLKLQGSIWKDLAKLEKELCRMESQGNMPLEKYRSELKTKLLELRKQQNRCELTTGLINFIKGIKNLNSVEKHYFLKWLKFNLDCIARENLSNLWAAYKEKYKTLGNDDQKIVEIDQLISSSSLGVEHFLRELGQFYEAEYAMVKEGNISEKKRQFGYFPSIVADLLLEGFPLELIDGDASNIPLQWITDVLTELNNKVKGQSKLMVITVLGVQSTGKSTLLNTMFGLQFAVSSGRCTQGAFMTLLKLTENLTQELGCDFILVIDTEGLKAPELSKLEDSYQHDNELATLVIGLSDITIVNMAMENATEMKDILQIVTHAFLRMEKIGQKPNCQFVHQNVNDVAAPRKTMRDRKHLLEQLNEMTQAAAIMEKLDRNIKFSDIMDYDPELHNWYIPSLWHGVPPTAPVNLGYTEKVFELKKYLFEVIRDRALEKSPQNITEFIEWVKSLWNAVKHENFIFSFRNSLIAEAYTNLSVKFSEWEWSFRREMHLWVSEQSTIIQNVSPDEHDHSSWQSCLQDKLSAGEKQVLESLKQFFERKAVNVHLVERYKEDFVRSANSLKVELKTYCYNKCKEALHIAKCQHKIDSLQAEYLNAIKQKVDRLLGKCREKNKKLEDEELKGEFERMWKETLLEISPKHLERREIYSDVELYLKRDFSYRGGAVNMKLQEAKSLFNYRINSFQMKTEYINSSYSDRFKRYFLKKEELCKKIEEFAHSMMGKCISYIYEKINKKKDYDETYCGELLRMINDMLQQPDVLKLHTTSSFEVDLKLHILGEAAHVFQKIHENFLKENDPQERLEKLKSQYFSTFRDLYLEKDAQLVIAKDFCNQCLQSALLDYVDKRLGIVIMDDILSSTQSIGYASRSFFQFTVLKELLEERNFTQYMKYITAYEEYVKSWVLKQILDHYRKSQNLKNLEKEILSAILKKIKETLENLRQKDGETVLDFLENFCQEMQRDLVISNYNLIGMQFTSSSPQFASCVKKFLPDLQKTLLSDLDILDIESKLSSLSVKPQDEIFKKVFGCGKQCPFCKVPCEAGGSNHKEHFAAVHQPQGLGIYKDIDSEKLVYNLCSTLVASESEFQCEDTDWEWHQFKDYRVYYPDWCIQPDPSINASDYWKFFLKEFNHDLAQHYGCKPADLPEDWKNLTKEHALQALKETYNMKLV